LLDATKIIIVSAIEVVAKVVIEIVVPEVQVAALLDAPLVSFAGLEPMARPVSTVEVEALPEVVDNPLHSVTHVPTVVAPVKKV
jgi:hypothetical protein